MQSLNKQEKKKPCSASMIRLISKCIYLCGDYIGILLAEWIAFHIRNYLMGNIFQVSDVYIYVVTPAVFLLALAFVGILFQALHQCTNAGKAVQCLSWGHCLFPSSSCSLPRYPDRYHDSTLGFLLSSFMPWSL